MADKGGPQSVVWALFSLNGRIRRATYGLGMAMIFSVWWVAISQVFAVREASGRYEIWVLALGLVALGSAYCIYALCHKRVHDLGYPGPYALVVVLAAPFFTGIIWIPLLLLGILKGQDKANKYGPPPVR